ncbi:hypothetical protein GPJ56_006444 [Histomonas meleagridis]|uniref:uncharacterized protein n=1 Tax=Histomonas meleagridis TaxID=135588 RepID=UPI00355976FE|nr:hypothetical protein GPJ56_006444 [Histomonas meleagridis]KAH0796740.1 hypothetical protein GO595_010633 [Histomonas meleagridis]
MEKAVPVLIRPIFDEPGRMLENFVRSGFDDYEHFDVFSNYCFIYFNSISRAKEFVSAFNNTQTRHGPVEVFIYDFPQNSQNRYEPGRMHSKTISVKNYPYELLHDRNIWNDFRETGFIRQIEVRGYTAYVQFDTEEDAMNAVRVMRGRRIRGVPIDVELIPDRILNLPNIVVPLIVAEDKSVEKSNP